MLEAPYNEVFSKDSIDLDDVDSDVVTFFSDDTGLKCCLCFKTIFWHKVTLDV